MIKKTVLLLLICLFSFVSPLMVRSEETVDNLSDQIKEYTLKLDYYFDILTKNEIQKEETPIKIINIVDKTYFVFTKGNTIYIRDLE